MNKSSGKSTGVFMMEMIMVVFFFILCASTCILVFAKANSMSKLAKDTNHGVVVAESVAEVWKAEGLQGFNDRFYVSSDQIDVAETEQGSCTIFWGPDWTVTGSNMDVAYVTEVIWKKKDDVSEAEVMVSRVEDGAHLYTLLISKYVGNVG